MVDVFAAPHRDRCQVIHEHEPGRILVDDTGPGLGCTGGVVLIQITQQGRDDEQTKALYRALANRLEAWPWFASWIRMVLP